MRIVLLGLSVVTTIVSLAGCGQGNQTVTVKDSEGVERTATVADSGDTRTVKSGDGLITATGTQGGKNARFPAFAPQYPGSTVQAVVDNTVGTAATGGVKMHIITMRTDDAPDAVMAFYKSAAGGKRLQELPSGTGPTLIIGGTGMTDYEAAITAMPTPSGGTSVNVTLQERFSPS